MAELTGSGKAGHGSLSPTCLFGAIHVTLRYYEEGIQ